MNPVIYAVIDPAAEATNERMLPVAGVDNGDGTASLKVSKAADEATAAYQLLELAVLNSIDAGIPAALGTTTDAASLPVTASTEDKATQTAISTNTSNTNSSVTSMSAKLPATLGQKTMANSMAVALASDQSSIPVTVSGVATAANQASGLTLVGAVTETAPASDTASSGLNGRLQRIAQRLTSLIAQLPATLGQKASSASLAVVIASDQSAVTVASSGNFVRVARTRPANSTPYSALDVIGDVGGSAIITFPSFGATNDNMRITSCRVRYDVAGLPAGMAALRLHLYTASPTAIVDNAAWDLVAGDRASYVGFVDIPTPADLGATLFAQVDRIDTHVKLASTSLFGVLQTIGGFTPAANSETFSVELGGVKF